MGIPLSSQFELNTALPLRRYTVVANTAARDAIPPITRHDGFETYVLDINIKYILQDGITNTDWVVAIPEGGTPWEDATGGINYAVGNVGIAEAIPLAKLHINGGVGTLATGLVFGDGDTGIYEAQDNWLYFNTEGTDRFIIRDSRFTAVNVGGGAILNEFTSATNPVITFASDLDTGLGSPSNDILSLIVGAVEGLRINKIAAHSVAGIANYETLVIADDDIPNKKYVDNALPNWDYDFGDLINVPTDITDLSLYSTTNLSEGTNLYYTEARVTANVSVTANTLKVTFPGFSTLLADYSYTEPTHTFADLTTTPTTLSGYGITDTDLTDLSLYSTTDLSEGNNLYYTEARVSANVDVVHTNRALLDTYTQTEVNLASAVALKHAAVTIGTANGLSLSTQTLSLELSSTSTTGALSSTDWNTFNNKVTFPGFSTLLADYGYTEPTHTFADLTVTPTSLSGYGITDTDLTDLSLYSTTDLVEGTNLYYTEVRVSANTNVTANTAKVSFPGFGTLSGDYGYTEPTHAFGDLTSTPSTLAGYGITDAVNTFSAQSVGGIKTFTSFSITPSSAPSTNYQVANKKYVDDALGVVSSEYIVRVATQSTHGFDNDFIYHNGSIWAKAIASTAATCATHFAIDIDVNTFKLVPVGEIDSSGMLDDASAPLVKGTFYFLSQTIAGNFSSAKPASGITQAVLIQNETNEASISIQEPYDISLVDSGGSGGATAFLELTDTPATFVANKFLQVNSGGTSLILVDSPAGSGTVTNVSSLNTDTLTVINGTSTPQLLIKTAAVANGAATLANGDAIYDFVTGLGYTTNVGDITGVTAGSGITGGGTSGTPTITLGTPASITSTSTNSVSSTSHQHELNDLITGGSYTSADITVDAKGRITSVASGASGSNYYATGHYWTGGTTSGPIGTLTMSGVADIPFATIPKATSTGSGIITTTIQTFAGVKTFNDKVTFAGDMYVGLGSATNSWFTIHGADGTAERTGMSIGESGKMGSAALHIYYTGDGYGHIGMGAVTTNSNAVYEAMRFYYLSRDVSFLGGATMAGDLAVDTDTLFVDVSTDRVGINDSTPSYSLDVNGTGRFTGQVNFNTFPITPSAAPDANYEVANKKYVDDQLGSIGEPIFGADNQIPYMNSGGTNFEYSSNIRWDGDTLIIHDGQRNVNVGYGAGDNISSGWYNTCIGYDAGGVLASNSNNTYVGDKSGQNHTGSTSVFIGQQAGRSITGNDNVMLGYNTGLNGGSAISGSIYIGTKAGARETGSARFYVDNMDRLSQSSARTGALLYGEMNSTNYNQQLTVNGTLEVQTTKGALIVPRITTTNRNALTAEDGMIVYDTTADLFYFRQDGAWKLHSGNTTSKATQGHTVTNEGVQIRWGTFSSSLDTAQYHAFSTAFTSACGSVVVDIAPGSTVTKTKYGFTLDRLNELNGTVTGNYIAIGW